MSFQYLITEKWATPSHYGVPFCVLWSKQPSRSIHSTPGLSIKKELRRRYQRIIAFVIQLSVGNESVAAMLWPLCRFQLWWVSFRRIRDLSSRILAPIVSLFPADCIELCSHCTLFISIQNTKLHLSLLQASVTVVWAGSAEAGLVTDWRQPFPSRRH